MGAEKPHFFIEAGEKMIGGGADAPLHPICFDKESILAQDVEKLLICVVCASTYTHNTDK